MSLMLYFILEKYEGKHKREKTKRKSPKKEKNKFKINKLFYMLFHFTFFILLYKH